mgnify:CR=1 FL=1
MPGEPGSGGGLLRPTIAIAFTALTVGVNFAPRSASATGFGPLTYQRSDSASRPDYGWILTLSPLHRAVFNIENAGDLLQWDQRFFHPDLVTAGREIALSAGGYGPDGTRLIWRARPWRNLRNSRADFQLLPPLFINRVRSTEAGSLGGYTAPGGIVEFAPLAIEKDTIATYLHHRDGYYGFAPVEFVHARRIADGMYLTFGGFFPASGGRFENSRLTGQTLFAELNAAVGAGSRLKASLMQVKNHNGIPFIDRHRSIERSDFDLHFQVRTDETHLLEVAAYRFDRVEKFDDFRSYGWDGGVRLRYVGERLAGFARCEWIGLGLPVSTWVHETECEGSLTYSGRWGRFSGGMQVGLFGWFPRRVRPVLSVGVDLDLRPYGRPFAVVQQAVDPHSIEVMHADYRDSKPVDDLEPVWRVNPDLPITGLVLPVTVIRTATAGWHGESPLGKLTATAFIREDIHPHFWAVEGDSVIVPRSTPERRTVGGSMEWRVIRKPLRGGVMLTAMDRDHKYFEGSPAVCTEPEFRLIWDLGWHRTMFDGTFEIDLMLCGRYYDWYYGYGLEGWKRIGGAYPLGFQATARIGNFTIYWGLRNWNSYRYELVPGYRMMHKEEYWGIHWLLFD